MKNRKIKCVVWDLDDTMWSGILSEGDQLELREGITEILEVLDKRGILLSISSKNDYNASMDKLKEFGIEKYFIYPQINWNPKSESIKRIAELINIGRDSIAFVDDQFFERDEVNFTYPEIFCIDAAHVDSILAMPVMTPTFLVEDFQRRRELYQRDIERNSIEEDFQGTKEEFLATLDMIFTISRVMEGDLMRAEELTLRTHQLNATGYTYSYDELYEMSKSDKYQLLIMELKDKFGSYGKIGLLLIEMDEDAWRLKLLLMSCRVMSKGVGSVALNYALKKAKEANAKFYAEFLPNDWNRKMLITYRLSGFKEVSREKELVILEHDLNGISDIPYYIQIVDKV